MLAKSPAGPLRIPWIATLHDRCKIHLLTLALLLEGAGRLEIAGGTVRHEGHFSRSRPIPSV